MWQQPEKIIIADDHPMFRAALKQSIQGVIDGIQCLECESSDELKTLLMTSADADLLVLDLNMPGVDGFSALAYVRQHHNQLPILMISADDHAETIMMARHFGALGFVSKSASIEEIRSAVTDVLEGNEYYPYDFEGDKFSDFISGMEDTSRQVASLTPQQYKVLGMIKLGLLNKQIAYELEISEATVKAHITAIMRKLQVNNRTQAVMKVAYWKFD